MSDDFHAVNFSPGIFSKLHKNKRLPVVRWYCIGKKIQLEKILANWWIKFFHVLVYKYYWPVGRLDSYVYLCIGAAGSW